QRLLTGAVRFPGFEGRPWRRRTLQELLQIDYGKSPNGVRDDEGIFPIYGTGGIVGSSNQALCDKPAIIVGRKGTINKPQLAVTPFWAIDTTYYCVPRSHVDVAWAYYTLNHMALEKYNEASGVPSLLRTTLYSIYVEVPELYEQQKIAAVLRACDDEIDLLQQKLAALEQQKKGLMQRLLTGQVRVKV
ncbi:MAG: restriction endonuclease subunit S, partial [Anaerolineales bacterium]|nr:restriction endonuclease subunit S [Anaerolineales bacterium]